MRGKWSESIMAAAAWAASLTPAALTGAILSFLLFNGGSAVTWDFLTSLPIKGGLEGGILPAIIGSIYVSALCILIAAPIGLGAGTYLAEYAPDNLFTKIVKFFVELLAAIPSIVIGLFGYAFLVHGLRLGFSVLSGALALAFMILPWTVRVSEEAIRAVPREYRYASLALGASKWETIMRVVYPTARPAIITGLMLGLGKAVGEAAVLIMTAGSGIAGYLPVSPLDPARTLPVHLYLIASEVANTTEGLRMAYGTALVLIALFLAASLPAIALRNYFARRLYGRGG